jgi:hypothetical protein
MFLLKPGNMPLCHSKSMINQRVNLENSKQAAELEGLVGRLLQGR